MPRYSMSFRTVGGRVNAMMALTRSSAGAMPSADTVWLRNFSWGWTKTHFAGLRTNPNACSLAKSFARWTVFCCRLAGHQNIV